MTKSKLKGYVYFFQRKSKLPFGSSTEGTIKSKNLLTAKESIKKRFNAKRGDVVYVERKR